MRPAKAAGIRVIHYGIDPIGAEVVRLVAERPDVESVAAIDSAKAGRDLGEAAALGRKLGITIAFDPQTVLTEVEADIVLHASEVSLADAYPQILQALMAGKNVISSCPELTFPWVRYPDLARRLDQQARNTGVAVLGTGIYPGFISDTLPLLLAAACRQVKGVRVIRVADIAPQGLALRHKAGIGLSPEGFRRAASNGGVGLMGLRESLDMLADTLGWSLDDRKETLETVIAGHRVVTDYYLVERGYVLGLRQTASGFMGDREVVRLEMEISLGAENPRDEIVIEGTPPLRLAIPGGLPGELAAAAIMVNCAPAVVRSGASGLLSMRDMPIAPYRPQGLSAQQGLG